MEEQCSPLSWSYYYQEEGVEELKHSLLYSTLELEAAILSAHEEISRKDHEIIQIKDLLAKIAKERDEFQAKCQQLSMEKQMLLQLSDQCPISSNTTGSNQDDSFDLSPSHCDDNAGSPGRKDSQLLLRPSPDVMTDEIISPKMPFPEKGKFLQAVMEAGPLLQTLLLAGPLPQWQHPPPQLSSVDIPPVTISSPRMHKRSAAMVNSDDLDPSPHSNRQKVCSPIIIDPNI